MFKEHNYAIWGDYCECGQECFILQNKFHPWIEAEFKIKIQCNSCGKELEIDGEKASEFYSKKILSYFDNVEGICMDMGCGGGFLSSFLMKNEKVSKIYAIDNDSEYSDEIKSLDNGSGKISFINMDIRDLDKQFKDADIDYLVSRDVFMFIEDTEKFLDDATRIVSKGIRHMGWYVSGSERMKNNLHPEQIAQELERRGWKVKLEPLNWYKYGYFIEANK